MPDVLVYAKPFCPYCSAARALLGEKGVSFREIDISGSPAEREEMIRRTGRYTVPQIFIGDRHVGGYDDLAALDEQGELDALLGKND
jgi:glutaredoxin 3